MQMAIYKSGNSKILYNYTCTINRKKMEELQEQDDEIQIQLRLILVKLDLILDRIDLIYTPIKTRWLSEENTMKILNLNKRGMEDLRSKHVIRTGSATGRNFLYYIPDIENYIYDNSAVRKRRKNPNKHQKRGKSGEKGGK